MTQKVETCVKMPQKIAQERKGNGEKTQPKECDGDRRGEREQERLRASWFRDRAKLGEPNSWMQPQLADNELEVIRSDKDWDSKSNVDTWKPFEGQRLDIYQMEQ